MKMDREIQDAVERRCGRRQAWMRRMWEFRWRTASSF